MRRQPRNKLTINLLDDHDTGYWMEELGITEPDLRMIIDEVGPKIDDVRRAVKWRKATDQTIQQ